MAKALAADGWQLLLTDSCGTEPLLSYPLATEAELDAVAAECGGSATAFAADTRDQAAMNAAVALAAAQFGSVDAAVACAGVMWGGAPAWRTPEEAWNLQMDVNLTGVWRLARAAVPALLEQPVPRHGRFVAVASAATTQGLPQLAAYSASKAGVLGLIRSMAVELAPEGITANAVCPGSTDTELLNASARVYGMRSRSEFAKQQPIGRLIEPDEIAAVVAWLCGPSASAVTGAAIAADGGMTAH